MLLEAAARCFWATISAIDPFRSFGFNGILGARLVELHNAKFFLTLLFLAISISAASADAESDELVPAGHGVRVFLGYLLDYKPDSSQSEFVVRKLSSFGVESSDQKIIIQYLLNLDAEIRTDIATGEEHIFCGESAMQLNGLELQPVFNAYLDFVDATYARYSAVAAAELSGLGYPDLIDRFDENAKGAGPFGVRIDRSDAEGAEYFDNERAKICE